MGTNIGFWGDLPMSAAKQDCRFYRTGSGPIKAGSKPCLQNQRSPKAGNCQSCEFYQPPAKAAKPVAAPVAPAAPQEKIMNAMPTMTEVHNELFRQLKRLNDDNLKGDDLKREVERSNAVTALSQTMINNAALVLKAHLGIANSTAGPMSMPNLITTQKVVIEEGHA
jgi:hypothetical protein